MADRKATSDRLNKLAGFDTTKRPALKGDIINEVLGEIRQEREEKAREVARDLIRKAIELREQAHKLEKEFEGKVGKIYKELDKVLNQVDNADKAAAKPVEPEAVEPTE